MVLMRRAGIAVAIVVLVVFAGWAARFAAPLGLVATEVPLGADDVGLLAYRGGLVLEAGDPRFGGLSGLQAQSDGSLLAVSDAGVLFRLVPEIRDGRLVGASGQIEHSTWQATCDLAGNQVDAESLAPDEAGVLVAFESDHRVERWQGHRRERLEGPPTEGLGENSGYEATARLADGRLFVVSEGGSDDRALAWFGVGPTSERHTYQLVDGFVPTGADRLPDGGLVLVERRYRREDGVRARIVVLTPAALAEEHLVPEEWARLEAPLTIDNLEGITVLPVGEETWILLVSDDNFSSAQRTLLLAFRLP